MTLDGGLYLAPIPSDITDAIDIGTGAGMWAIDFADKHPKCNVIGTDLSPIQPTWVPPNCEFIVDDADKDQEWIFPPMDFIHSRLLTAGFRGWQGYIGRCFSALKPGGWLEFQETEFPLRCDDGSSSKDDPLIRWSALCAEASSKVGIDPTAHRKFPQYLADAGFINIVRKEYKWPVGPWTEDDHLNQIGAYMMPNTSELLNSAYAFFTRLLGWTNQEVEIFIAQCRTSIKDSNSHRYLPISVTYAQKPFENSSSSSSTTRSSTTSHREQHQQHQSDTASSSNPTESATS